MAFRKRYGRRKSEFYYYDFIHVTPDGTKTRHRGCTFESIKTRARDVEAQIRQRLKLGEPEPLPDVTFEELAEEYRELHVKGKKAKDFYENRLVVMERHFGKMGIATIGVREVEEFIIALRTRKTRPAAPATCNRYQSVGRHMWNKAQAWGRVAKGTNPWAELARGHERLREKFLSDDEASALLSVLPEWPRAVVLAALHTGARRGELLRLQWSDVDFERGLVRFLHTKNGEDRAVPMTATLVTLLKQTPSRFQAGPVFLGADKKPIEVEALRSAFRRAVVDAGLPGLRFHDLRHSAASFMVQGGVSLFEVQKVLGHRDIRMTQRYAHLAPEHLRGAVAVLDRIGAAKQPKSEARG